MKRRSLILITAFVIAGLGAGLVVIYVQGIDARATEGQQRVPVLTVTETIDPGETVAEAEAAGKLRRTTVVRADLVDGALASTSAIADAAALDAIYPGEQVIAQNFGKPGREGALPIPDDKLAVSVELTDPARVAGFVVPGSQVAVFVSGDPEIHRADGSVRKLAPYTRLILAKVDVIGVGDTAVAERTTTTAGEETIEQIPRTILTVAVDQEQATRLIYAARNGDLSFALRSGRSKVVDGPGVTARDVMPELFRRAAS